MGRRLTLEQYGLHSVIRIDFCRGGKVAQHADLASTGGASTALEVGQIKAIVPTNIAGGWLENFDALAAHGWRIVGLGTV